MKLTSEQREVLEGVYDEIMKNIPTKEELDALEFFGMFQELESHKDADGNFVPYGHRIPFERVTQENWDVQKKLRK